MPSATLPVDINAKAFAAVSKASIVTAMALDPTPFPDDVATLKAMLVAANARALDLDAQIANLKLTIAKMRRDTFGPSSERGLKLIDQMELQLAELVETVTGGKAAVEIAAPTAVASAEKPARRPLPSHLPREQVVHQAAAACPCCGGQLRKLGEDITETLELVPAAWKVIQHVREKYSCRRCEVITQAPAPNHPIARGRAGPQLLAHVLFSKYRAHLVDDLERWLRQERRKARSPCGSDTGGRRAAAIYTLIETCALNDVDARAWLADILARIADHPAKRIAELLPWHWKAAQAKAA